MVFQGFRREPQVPHNAVVSKTTEPYAAVADKLDLLLFDGENHEGVSRVDDHIFAITHNNHPWLDDTEQLSRLMVWDGVGNEHGCHVTGFHLLRYCLFADTDADTEKCRSTASPSGDKNNTDTSAKPNIDEPSERKSFPAYGSDHPCSAGTVKTVPGLNQLLIVFAPSSNSSFVSSRALM